MSGKRVAPLTPVMPPAPCADCTRQFEEWSNSPEVRTAAELNSARFEASDAERRARKARKNLFMVGYFGAAAGLIVMISAADLNRR